MERPNHSEHPDTGGNETVNRAAALAAAKTWDELHALLLERDQVLLDKVGELLAVAVEFGEEEGLDKDKIAWYGQLRDLLRRCHEIGIDTAMEEFEMPLFPSKADPQAVHEAHSHFLEAYFAWGGGSAHASYDTRVGSAVREVLEREQHIFLTDTMDFYLQYMQERFPRSDGDDTRNQHRSLFRQARQVGIDKAWKEYIQITQGKDWAWVKLFEVFEQWVHYYGLGREESFSKHYWGKADLDLLTIYEGHRKERQFLEAHLELLNLDFFEGPLTTEITDVEQYVDSYDKQGENIRKSLFLPPSLQSDPTPFAAPYSGNSRTRVIGLIVGQNLLRDVYHRGGTPQAIRDAYVNAYGGLVLDLPPQVEDILQQLSALKDEEYEALLYNSVLRLDADPTVAPEIVAELGCRYLKAVKRRPNRDTEQVQQVRINWYTAFQTIYTRERYPYQWMRIQQELAKIYMSRAENRYPDDVEKAIQCYEDALHIITRNVSYQTCELTDNNLNWAIIQSELGGAYAQRLSLDKSLDRQADLARATASYRAALSFFTPERSLYGHRDMLLHLAFLEIRHEAAEAHRQGQMGKVLEAYQRADQALQDARQANLELSWSEYYLQDRIQHIVTWSGVRKMYASHAWCLWKLGKIREAVLALEEGRAQALGQAFAITSTGSKGLCDFHAQELAIVRFNWQKQLAEGSPDDIRKARNDLLDLRNAIRDHCQQDFLPRESTYQQIIESLDTHQVLIYVTATEQGGLAFVIPPARGQNRDPIAIALPKLTEQRVDDWLIRPDENRWIIGGYQFALQQRGAELLRLWTLYPTGDQQERERRLAIPICDLPEAISAPFTTLRIALKDTIEAWQLKADDLSKQLGTSSQKEARELHEVLASPLQGALEKKIFSTNHTFNWFLLQAELDLLQQELSDTLIADLRQELDHLGLSDSDQPVALIPCGQLGMLPLHAAWAGHNRWTGAPIPFAETCELTYQASARSLAAARQAIKTLSQQGPIIAIGNPLPTKEKPLEWATAEAEAIVALASKSHQGSKAIVENAATRAEIEATLQELQAGEKQSGAWIHIASHGHADPTDPENCYMLLSANEKLTLADLQRRQLLSGVRGFIASGCTTALGDLERAPDELISLAAGALQAGAPCAIATFWTVSDVANFLLMVRFMRELLRKPSSTPAHALREAAKWLRTITREQLGSLAKKGLEGIRSVPEDLTSIPHVLRGAINTDEEASFVPNDTLRLSLQQAFPALKYVGVLPDQARASHPFEHASYWAATIIYGA